MNAGTYELKLFLVIDGLKQKAVWAFDKDDAIDKTKSSSKAEAYEIIQERN